MYNKKQQKIYYQLLEKTVTKIYDSVVNSIDRNNIGKDFGDITHSNFLFENYNRFELRNKFGLWAINSNGTVENSFDRLEKGLNILEGKYYEQQDFFGDGVTSSFTHNFGTTNYKVYINGIQITEAITKNANVINFDFTPRSTDIITLKKEVTPTTKGSVFIDVYQPVGEFIELYNIDTIKIDDDHDVVDLNYFNNEAIEAIANEKYEIKMDTYITTVEDIEALLKDKVFRLKVLENDGSYKIYSKCELRKQLKQDGKKYTSTIIVRATDYYKN
ncbi:MAG: hypothetical protein PWQ45_97 [Thermosipho sp. (in: thermotogales)]|nr:hypothetical protein [Thermosipho sp. (in: thermotogales)]